VNKPLFQAAYPYVDDVLSLPVESIDAAASWYSEKFGMVEVLRSSDPQPTVVLERDGTRIGFSQNGGDPSQDGAAILVTDIQRAKSEIESTGFAVGELKVEERDDQKFKVFFVVAPDGLCFYFHQLLAD